MESPSESRCGRQEVAKDTPSRLGKDEVDMHTRRTVLPRSPIHGPARKGRKRNAFRAFNGIQSVSDSNEYPIHSSGHGKKRRYPVRNRLKIQKSDDSDGASSAHSVGFIRYDADNHRRLSVAWRQKKRISNKRNHHGGLHQSTSTQRAHSTDEEIDSVGGVIRPKRLEIDEYPSLNECLHKLSLLRVVVPYQKFTAAGHRLLSREAREEFINLSKEGRVNWLKDTVVPPEIAAFKVAPEEDAYDPNAKLEDLPDE